MSFAQSNRRPLPNAGQNRPNGCELYSRDFAEWSCSWYVGRSKLPVVCILSFSHTAVPLLGVEAYINENQLVCQFPSRFLTLPSLVSDEDSSTMTQSTRFELVLSLGLVLLLVTATSGFLYQYELSCDTTAYRGTSTGTNGGTGNVRGTRPGGGTGSSRGTRRNGGTGDILGTRCSAGAGDIRRSRCNGGAADIRGTRCNGGAADIPRLRCNGGAADIRLT